MVVDAGDLADGVVAGEALGEVEAEGGARGVSRTQGEVELVGGALVDRQAGEGGDGQAGG